jgi:class 3 adenylate cyclase
MTTPNAFRCPHCGHSILDQESSSGELLSYIELLESFSLVPAIRRRMLREGSEFVSDLCSLPVLVAKMDHYINLVNQHTASISDRARPEIHAGLLNRVLGAIIPVIDQRGGSILELGQESILAAWVSPVFEDAFTRAVSTALEMQEVLLRLGEKQAKSQDFALRIGIASGFVYAGTIGTSTCRSFTVIGPAVIEAARLSDVAEPSQTLVDHNIYKWTKDAIIYEQPITKSGLAEPVQSQYYVALREKVVSAQEKAR